MISLVKSRKIRAVSSTVSAEQNLSSLFLKELTVLRDVLHWLPVASEDTVQNCCTDFWVCPRHRACILPQHCVHSRWQLWPSWSPRETEHGICLLHKPEQLDSVGGAFSSQLQLSGTHCRFTFAPHPSVAVSFEQGSRVIFSGWPFTDFSSENYWRDWTELNL